MKSNYDMIIWIFIFLLIALIIGLYISEKKRIPNALYMRTGGSSTPYIEHFEQPESAIVDGYKNSSSFDVTGGASSKYGWGINDSDNYERNNLEKNKEEGQHVKKCIQKKDEPMCTKDNIVKKNKESCYNCDILQHPSIDKYVLKSSVPACPKVDLNEYIRKSEIPACPPKIDLSQYIKKSEIPSEKVCPIIEKCPTCPQIPDKDSKHHFNIMDTNKLSKNDIKLLLKDDRIKKYLDDEYEEKNKKNIPVNNNSSPSTLFETNIPVKSEEYEVNYNSSISLWDEIKSLFGYKSNKIIQEEESKNNKIKSIHEEESKNITQRIQPNKVLLPEEENKMIYNIDIDNNNNNYNNNIDNNIDNNFFKQNESNAMGMYAGDSLYASV